MQKKLIGISNEIKWHKSNKFGEKCEFTVKIHEMFPRYTAITLFFHASDGKKHLDSLLRKLFIVCKE